MATMAIRSSSTEGCWTRSRTCVSPRSPQQLPGREFRHIYVDHRGLGQSDKPHHADAYAMQLRVRDAVAVLDRLGIERAHFICNSWGGRLGFGIGEHAPERVLSLVIGGNQPYGWPDGPLARTVTEALVAARTEGRGAWRVLCHDGSHTAAGLAVRGRD
jgi:pimeloyl-ACP methyl ester carboxylesterase